MPLLEKAAHDTLPDRKTHDLDDLIGDFGEEGLGTSGYRRLQMGIGKTYIDALGTLGEEVRTEFLMSGIGIVRLAAAEVGLNWKVVSE